MIYDLDILAKELTDQLREMGLIWNAIQEQFQLLVLNLIIKSAIEMGFLDIEREKFMEGVAQSKKLAQSEEGELIKKAILDGTNIDMNLNVLTLISE